MGSGSHHVHVNFKSSPEYLARHGLRRLKFCCGGFLLMMVSPSIHAQTNTFTGVTGVLGTPDALIAQQGSLNYQYNNFIEPDFLNTHERGNNHTFTLGVFKRFELGGRLTDFEPLGDKFNRLGGRNGKRDLSANVKLNVYSNSNRFWFSVGATDVAGLAQNFSSQYAVSTARFGSTQISAGYATGDSESFSGFFLNTIHRVNPYFALVAEKDTDNSIGAGLVASIPVSKQLSIDAALSGGDEGTRASITGRYRFHNNALSAYNPARYKNDHGEASDSIEKFIYLLSADNFQHIRVGQRDDNSVVVHVENRLYTHSDYDAIVQIVESALTTLPGGSNLEVALTDQQVSKFRFTLTLPGQPTDAKTSLPIEETNLEQADRHTSKTSRVLLSQAEVLPPRLNKNSRTSISWHNSDTRKNNSVIDITLNPALASAVGTEFGTVDFSLAARLGVSVPLWKGAQIVVNSLLPIADTNNFKDGQPFEPRAFTPSVERMLLLQNLPPVGHIYSQFELGQVQIRGFDYATAKIQAAWQSNSYPLLIHARAGQYNLQDSDVQRSVALGTLSYSFDRIDSVVDATYGQFLFGEHAVKITATRRFGNSFFSLFLKIIDEEDSAGGLRFSTPFGPKKGFQWKKATFSGARWSHALQTTIKFPRDNRNRLQDTFLLEPLSDSEIPRRLLDSGRLNQHYMQQISNDF